MKISQKIYESDTINNKINKGQSTLYHKKNLDLIKKRKSFNTFNEEELLLPKRKNNLGNNFQSGKKLF
jgi:hypothetical protein